jgi:hypothetical protein
VREPITSSDSTPEPNELSGRWSFRRRLMDYRAGTGGSATGLLTISAGPDGPRWHEVGNLTWAGQQLAITRTMGFTHVDGEWWVTFEDGRPFHPWHLGSPVTHPCAADTYFGRLHLDAGDTRLRIVWDVTGPTKHQRILTRYLRMSDPHPTEPTTLARRMMTSW